MSKIKLIYKLGDTVKVPIKQNYNPSANLLPYVLMGEFPPDFDTYELVLIKTKEQLDFYNSELLYE